MAKPDLLVPSNKKLTVEVAHALLKIIKEQGVLVKNSEKYLDIQVKDVETGEMIPRKIPVPTVRNWASLNTIILGTDKRFGDLFNDAKQSYKLEKKAQEDKHLLSVARRNVLAGLNLETESDSGFIGITSRRDPKTGKRIETNRYKQKFTGTDAVKLKIKTDTTLKVLEKLDPAFKKDDAGVKVDIKLSFLTIADKEQEMIKLGKIKTV